MNKFSWYDAQTVEEALGQVTATVSETIQPKGPEDAAVIKAGGVDLLDLMKEGLARPKTVVNIRNIPGLNKISFDKKSGLSLGANVTLAQMEKSAELKTSYMALYQAVVNAATPQLRNSATLGGNLAQRTRCWYFRSIDHECFRKGSGTCFAQEGQNEFHAIMKNGACCSVHSSTIATALMAFDAKVEVTSKSGKKEVAMEDFFVLPGDDSRRESILKADELITAVHIPAQGSKVKSYYIKQGARESYDWPIADVAVKLEMSGSSCKSAQVVLGAAAPVPIKSKAAAEALTGKSITEAIATVAAEASMQDATPLAKNAYKVAVFKAIVKRAILETV